ncbi:MAG: hypothetical protein LBB75_09090 [Oscillospiraceae bacterium]|nr:hypothetical protein [Oscillospiraceae bacterium]
MSSSTRTLLETVAYLPDAEQALIAEIVKRVILAWDPDFTKVTAAEKASIDEGLRQVENGETVSMEDLMRELEL